MDSVKHRIGCNARRLADRLAPVPAPAPPPPPPPEAGHLKRSLSVEGEDLLLACFSARQKCGLYVDVGAHHPIRFSNTFLLHERGWRGINIDAEVAGIEMFEKMRPGDINVHAMVSDVTEPQPFYRFEQAALNTTDRSWSKRYTEEGNVVVGEPVTMTPRRLSDILDKYLTPGEIIDVLNVDVEGSEVHVLRSIDWSRHRPGIVAIEITDCLTVNDALNSPTAVVLANHGYHLIARTYSTAIFCDPEYLRQWYACDLHRSVSDLDVAKRRVRLAPEPLRVILGASGIRYHGWLDTDKDVLDITDPAAWERLFGVRRAEALLAEHVFEHLPQDAQRPSLALCLEYLKPGGRLRIAVPDGHRNDDVYRQANAPPADGHTVFFNADTISALLAATGFEVRLVEWFDAMGVFHAQPMDLEHGPVRRSVRFDHQAEFHRVLADREVFYTSLIVDAIKPR